jgi:hypothetical protein
MHGEKPRENNKQHDHAWYTLIHPHPTPKDTITLRLVLTVKAECLLHELGAGRRCLDPVVEIATHKTNSLRINYS